MPDEQQRACIVERARQLFVTNGYGRTTTEDVAVACHISKQTLYRLFEGKCGLFTAVMEAHRREILDIQESYHALPLQTALEKIFRADIDDETYCKRQALIQLTLIESQHFPELGDIAKQGRDELQAKLADWLRPYCAQGEILIDDPMNAAGILLDTVLGSIITKALMGIRWPSGEERMTHIRRCINVFLNGVCPRPGGG